MGNKIHAVIPAVNNFFLDRNIEALQRQQCDITVVKARSFALFHQIPDTVRILQNSGEKLSCAEAKNRGAAAADGDYILFIDQDAMLFNGGLAEMLAVMADNPEVGIVGPAQFNMTPDGLKELTCAFQFSTPGYGRPARESGPVDAVSSFCMLVRRRCFEEVHGFDLHFDYGCEDLDFCWRAYRAGWKTYLTKKAAAFHCIGSGLAVDQETNQAEMRRRLRLRIEGSMIEPADPRKVLHVLGLAHTRAHPDYSYCAFTSLTRTFCAMMRRRGYRVIFYGVEGSQVDCDEFVPCLSNEDFLATYADNEKHDRQYKFNWEDGPAWPMFAERAEKEIKKRIGDQKEIVCVAGGGYHRFALGIPNAICIDPHVGHKAPVTRYRVFASKTWRAFVYGLFDEQLCKEHYPPPYWFDSVIYHYLDLHDFEFSQEKEGYAVFIGRLNQDKGVYDAMKACAQLGIPIKIAGANHPATEAQFRQALAQCDPYAEYIGTLKAADRSEVLRRARCVICPSYYNEPFGLVAIEAMACGTPIITTDWGAFAETNQHGLTGYRCSTFGDIKNALQIIDQLKPEDCRRWVEKNFTTEVAAKYYDHYFQKIHIVEAAQGNPFYHADAGAPIVQDLYFE